VVSEVMDSPRSAGAQYADILQVGARKHAELHPAGELGKLRKPVLLSAYFGYIEELLLSAEYILAGGNYSDFVRAHPHST